MGDNHNTLRPDYLLILRCNVFCSYAGFNTGLIYRATERPTTTSLVHCRHHSGNSNTFLIHVFLLLFHMQVDLGCKMLLEFTLQAFSPKNKHLHEIDTCRKEVVAPLNKSFMTCRKIESKFV